MKILSVNLWYDNYRNKTNAQLASFRQFGYETDVATISTAPKTLMVTFFSVTDNGITITDKKLFRSYRAAFVYIFEKASDSGYDLIYIRRLMSKLFYAASSIRRTGKCIPIIYEIPTYPLDTNETLLYRLRDSLEMKLYSSLDNYITLTTVILRQDLKLPDNWISFHNGIDINNYSVTAIPELGSEIRFLAVANMADWHRYDRMIYAMREYSGKYTVRLIIVAPENKTVNNLKTLVHSHNMESMVEFAGKNDVSSIRELARDCHIGVGQLSWSYDCPPQINTIKTKEYCAMGLPFFTSCRDTSFDSDYPYAYVLKKMDDELNLEDVIGWYEKIHENPSYKQEMYDYAKDNLQFHELVNQIQDRLK